MVLEIKNLYKNFGEKQVLRGVSFRAESGRAFGLLGRNGAGKTTTLRILMGVFPADSGEVLLDGVPLDPMHTGIGYLPEERGLYPKKKIFEQLVYFAQLKGMTRADAGRSVDKWLARLGMAEYRDKRLDTLSKGNQQKIQLITALAHDPAIVVLDEPFSGLDPVNAKLLGEVVVEEIARGKIVLFSSHQMNYIEEFCDTIAILNEGTVAVGGELYELKRRYARDRLVVRSEDAARIAEDFGERAERQGERRVLLRMPSAEDKSRVMQTLAGTYDIDGIRVYEPSLKDIFVEYAGGNTP